MTSYTLADVLDLLDISYPNRSDFYMQCPFCGKGGKHFNINLRENVYHCFKCDAGAGSFTSARKLYAQITGMDEKEAHKDILRRLNLDNNSQTVPIRRNTPTYTHNEKEDYIAPLEQRNLAYHMLLSECSLVSSHLDDLIRRGLTEEQIEIGGYKTVPLINAKAICSRLVNAGVDLKGVAGFYCDNGSWNINIKGSGYFVPVRTAEGLIQGMQIRMDKGNPRYCWFSSAKMDEILHRDIKCAPAKAWIHHVGIDGKKDYCYLTEGALKADIIYRLGNRPTIAVAGVNTLKFLPDTLNKLHAEGINKIYTAFDMDRYDNPAVRKAQQKIAQMIKNSGIKYIPIKWDKKYKGLDDYICALFQNKS